MIFLRRKRRGASLRTARWQWKASWLRRLRWLGMIAVLVGLSAGLYAAWERLLDADRFPLRQVHLEGQFRHLHEAEIRQVLNTYRGQNFFALDIGGVRARLEANPWIEQVTIWRHWPDTLKIQLRERIPFGYWDDDQLVDVNGVRFRPSTIRQPRSWPRLRGPEGHETLLIQTYEKASTLLHEIDLKLIQLVQDERRAWWMTFGNGIEISLGREHLEQRLRRFIAIYPRLLATQSNRIAAVDLRYFNGFAVRWKPASAG